MVSKNTNTQPFLNSNDPKGTTIKSNHGPNSFHWSVVTESSLSLTAEFTSDNNVSIS